MPTVRSWRSDVLSYLDDHQCRIVSSLRDLIGCPSISGSDAENDISAVLASDLGSIGLDVDHWPLALDDLREAADFPGEEVRRDDAWGLVGRLPGAGDGPSLMLNAHVDVVPPGDPAAWNGVTPFGAVTDSTSVHGRGACDMKGGLVAALWAVRAIAAVGVPLRGDLLLACVQGEEDGGLGTYATLRRGWRADACIIPEPTSLDLAPANGGALTFRLTVHGLATHASRRTRGVSAVEKFLPILAALRELEAERNRDPDPLMSRWDIAYPIEVGTVRAGDWASSVPDRLTAEGRFGVQLGEDVATARSSFEAAIAAACTRDPWLRDRPVDVEWWGGQFASGQVPADAPIVATLQAAHASVSSRPQAIWGAPYGSDLRLLAGIGDIPTVQYGPGDAALAHGPGESVPVAEVMTASRALAVAALAHCGMR